MDSNTTFVMKESGQKVELIAVFDSPEGRLLEVELPSTQRIKITEDAIVSRGRYIGKRTGVCSLWFTGGLTAGISAMLADLETWLPDAETIVTVAVVLLGSTGNHPVHNPIQPTQPQVIAAPVEAAPSVPTTHPDVMRIVPSPRAERVVADGIVMEPLPK